MVWNSSSAGESRTRRSVRGGQRRTKKVPLLSLERLEPRTMFTGNQAEAADLAVAPVLDVAAPIDEVELPILTASQTRTASSEINAVLVDTGLAAEPSQQSMTVNQYVDWLAEQAATQWNHLFGQSVNRYRPYFPRCGNDLSFQGFMPGIDLVDLDVGVITLADSGNDGMSLDTVAMRTLAMQIAGSAGDAMAGTSDTKVQVEGVDEARRRAQQPREADGDAESCRRAPRLLRRVGASMRHSPCCPPVRGDGRRLWPALASGRIC